MILYEMLCGERAWVSFHPSQIYYAIVEGKETLTWPDNIPSGLKGIAKRLLEYKAEARCTLDVALELIEDHL